MATSLFGNNLEDYEIEVIIHNPRIAQWFEQQGIRDEQLQRWQRDRSMRGKLLNLIKAAGIATGTLGAIRSVFNLNQERQDSGMRIRPGDKRPHDQITEVTTDSAGNIDDIPLTIWDPEQAATSENPRERARARDRARLDTRAAEFPDEPMDQIGNGDEPMPEAARAAGPGGGTNTVSKETPISPATPSYGLQETHTTILPWTGWLTLAGIGKGEPVQLPIRMNAPYDMLNVTLSTDPGSGAAFPTTGFFGYPSTEVPVRSPIAYPETIVGGGVAQGTERPAWRDYWASFYDYYTVLGCEYEIICEAPQNTVGNDVLIGVQFDTYSDTATSTGNVMPLTYYSDAITFKNIRWHRIKSGNAINQGNNRTIIKGTYKPGQAKRNITNDGDVKTWTATSTTLPNLKEILTLNFWRHPMNYANVQTTVNMEINLKYLVQYKDLKQQARYPNRITTNQDITTVLNESNSAAGSALQLW